MASLFRPADPAQEAKQRRLMAAVDRLNLYGGRGTVRVASTGIDNAWKMRAGRKSPCYTTRIADLPVMRV